MNDEYVKRRIKRFCAERKRKRLSEKLIKEELDKIGYRLIGQDPYHNYYYHVAKWTDDKCASVTDGWYETLREIYAEYLA